MIAGGATQRSAARITIVTPAYREALNLPALYERLCETFGQTSFDWDWLIIDDHSSDDTFAVIGQLAARDARVRGLRLARNGGSHRAILCGLQHARGDAVAVIAADLQDPPEILPELLAQWQTGAQVVWGARRAHPGETVFQRWSARLFHRAMRRITRIAELPANGADCFVIDKVVVDALGQFGERHVNLFILLAWLGYRSATVFYDKDARQHGRSGWTLPQKIKLLVDSITAFSYAPVRAMSYIGAVTAAVGFAYALYVVGLALSGTPPVGWSSLMVVVLLIGGLQMLMLGILGEYLWRTLDESRRRPRALIEAATLEQPVREEAARPHLTVVGERGP